MDTLWAKTLLSVYDNLDDLAERLDSLIYQIGIDQKYPRIHADWDVYEKIINLSEKKVTIINLKILIDSTLNLMTEKSVQIAEDICIHRMKVAEWAFINKTALRTAFRRVDKALREFTSILVARGYTEERLNDWLAREDWLFIQKDRANTAIINRSIARAKIEAKKVCFKGSEHL